METVNFFVYGNLKYKRKLSFLLPTGHFVKTTVKGFEMYDVGSCPGIVPGEGLVHGECWTFRLTPVQKKILFLKLDAVEGVWYGRFSRQLIKTSQGKTWVYVYRRSVRGKRKITTW